jgi:hypothetical protein
MKIMWNSKKYAVLAIVSAGLAVVAATPASACGGYYGAAYNGCGAYGYAPVYGSVGGCGAYGYTGVAGYAWPYASYGYADYPSYGYGGYGGYYGSAGCGSYGYAGYGGCGSYGAGYGGYGSYGYAPGYYGAAGYGCAAASRARSFGYATACRHNDGHILAGYRLHRGQVFASASTPKHRNLAAVTPMQGKIAHRVTNLKLTSNN